VDRGDFKRSSEGTEGKQGDLREHRGLLLSASTADTLQRGEEGGTNLSGNQNWWKVRPFTARKGQLA